MKNSPNAVGFMMASKIFTEYENRHGPSTVLFSGRYLTNTVGGGLAYMGVDAFFYTAINKRWCGLHEDVVRARGALSGLLGFTHPASFVQWAVSNPTLWGNGDGCYIFNGARAYVNNPESTVKSCSITLVDVANKFREVAEKIAAAEAAAEE